MKEMIKESTPIIILIVVCAALIGGITWLMNGGVSSSTEVELTDSTENLPAPLTSNLLEAYDVDITNDMNPVAVLNTNVGVIEIELYEDIMPITAGNFVNLIEDNFYDGTKFHRVMDNFMIQGGDPLTKTNEVLRYGTGGPGYSIPDEHIKHELLTNERGTISMANSGPNSGGSQFFINLVDNKNLDFDQTPVSSQHPVFGRVISGMEVVDSIAKTETNQNNLPLGDIVIESVTIRRDS